MDEIIERMRANHLKPDRRIALKMTVLDSDKKATAEFLLEFGMKLNW